MSRFIRTDRTDELCLGDRPIGPGHPAYIIAEAGVNHDGELEKALRLVDAAAEAGADAVKFQVFRADHLSTPDALAALYQRHAGHTSHYEMLRALELEDSDFLHIRDACRARRIEFLATPFSIPDLQRLMTLSPCAVKVASTDLTNWPLLEAIAGVDRPILLSTGASTAEEIGATVQHLRACRATERTVLLHCVSAYPTPLDAANLRAIGTKARRYRMLCGFSDHTTAVSTGAGAVAAGAVVLEKHITLDPTTAGPDHALSLSPDDFRHYVGEVRTIERALGNGAIRVHPLEEDVRRAARKSLVAIREVPAGTTLTADMFASKRPGEGVGPNELRAVIGRKLIRPLAANTPLTWEMLGAKSR